MVATARRRGRCDHRGPVDASASATVVAIRAGASPAASAARCAASAEGDSPAGWPTNTGAAVDDGLRSDVGAGRREWRRAAAPTASPGDDVEVLVAGASSGPAPGAGGGAGAGAGAKGPPRTAVPAPRASASALGAASCESAPPGIVEPGDPRRRAGDELGDASAGRARASSCRGGSVREKGSVTEGVVRGGGDCTGG